MAYCCTYDVLNLSGNLTTHRAVACFSAWYGHMNKVKELYIYVFKEGYFKGATKLGYQDKEYPIGYDTENSCRFSKGEINRYVELLQRIGFKLSYEEIEKFELSPGLNEDCYKFTITNENTPLSMLILCNAIRYLHETDFYKIVKTFLAICNMKGRMNTWNRFILAHRISGSISNSNHTIDDNQVINKFITIPQIRKYILENTNNYSCVAANIPKSISCYAKPGTGDIRNIVVNTFPRELQELFKNNASLKEIEAKYIETYNLLGDAQNY